MTEETPNEYANNSMLSRARSEFSFISGNFLVLIFSWIIIDIASEMPATYYGLYVKALGGSASIIGLIGSASMVARALVQIPGGYLADKYGRRWIISTMTFGIALGYAFYAFAPSWHWILVGAVVQSLCSIYGPALQAIIADSLPSDKRGIGFSIITLIDGVSTTPSPLIAGWLFQAYGLVPSVRMGYTFVVVAFIIAGIIRLRLKETLEDPPTLDVRDLAGSLPASIRESISVWGKVPRSAFALFATDVLLMASISIFMPIMVLYVVDDLGIPEVRWAVILTSLFISMILLSIPSGKIIDKYGKKRPLIVAYLVWIVTVPLFIYGDFNRLLLAMFLVGLMQVVLMSASAALQADLVPSEHRGKVAGSSNFFRLIAAAVGNLLGGYIYDNISHTLPWWLQIVFVVPCILIVVFFVKEPKAETSSSGEISASEP